MSVTSWQGITALSTVLPFICTIVVFLRFYARLKHKAELKFDDWAQVPTLIVFIGMSVSCLIGVAKEAIGYPDPPGLPTVVAPSIILCQKLVFIIQILQVFNLTITKCSALAFYRRIFCTARPSALNTIIWALITITTAWGIGFIGFYAGSCGSHPEAQWGGDLPFREYCMVVPKFEISFAASDFVLDTLVLIVPIPSIWHLKMTSGRKIGITAIFMMALIGYGACIARLATNVVLANVTFAQEALDIQSADTEAIWFSMLETGFTIIAVNLPSLWSLITQDYVGSITRSLREAVFFRSFQSKRGSRSAGSNARSYVRESSFSGSQQIELVAPEGTTEFCTTVERHNRDLKTEYDARKGDLENGIYVQISLQVTSKEQLRV